MLCWVAAYLLPSELAIPTASVDSDYDEPLFLPFLALGCLQRFRWAAIVCN